MSKLKDMREKRAKLAADARAKLDEITDKTPAERAAEIEAEFDRMMGEHDKLGDAIAREERVAAAEAAAEEIDAERRPASEGRAGAGGAGENRLQGFFGDDEARNAFDLFLRGGAGAIPREHRGLLIPAQAEKRAQSTTSTAGGYLIPQGFLAELVKSLAYWGPMLDPGVTRQLETDSGNALPWPTVDDTGNTGQLLAENTQDTELAITFGTAQLDAYKFSSRIILVSEELLQDSAIDVEAIIRDIMSERIGRIVNTYLTTGTGSSQPNGIVTASAAGATAAAAGAIAWDDMINLLHSVDRAYRMGPNIKWMFHDDTLKALRKLKDGNSNYIWQPANVVTGEPDRILDYPYAINNAMAQLSTSESPSLGEKTVLFGDMSKYIVRRVREWSMKRLVERYADYFQVGFLGMGRFDGELTDSGAVKHLVHPLA